MHVREAATSVYAAVPTPSATLPFQPTRAHRLDWLSLHQTPGGRLTRERTRAVRPLRRDPKRSVHLAASHQPRSATTPWSPLPHAPTPTRPSEIRPLDGVPVTTPERTIVDSLQAGTQPEQIKLAVHQALERGLTTPRRLRATAAERPARVRSLIEHALAGRPRVRYGDGAFRRSRSKVDTLG
jgi:hypothetical protein